jgi:hypothetical protein
MDGCQECNGTGFFRSLESQLPVTLLTSNEDLLQRQPSATTTLCNDNPLQRRPSAAETLSSDAPSAATTLIDVTGRACLAA